MRKFKGTMLKAALAASMVMSYAGIAYAAEAAPEGYEAAEAYIEGETATPSISSLNVSYYSYNNSISINCDGEASEIEFYINDKLVYTEYGTQSEWYTHTYAYEEFYEVLPGATYNIKAIPYLYDESGTRVGGSALTSKVTTTPVSVSYIDVNTWAVANTNADGKDNGYQKPYVYLDWGLNNGSAKLELERKEGKKGAWTAVTGYDGYSSDYSDYSVAPGKSYVYRIRTAAVSNEYAAVAAGAWKETSSIKIEASTVDTYVSYYDKDVNVNIGHYGGACSGFEVYRSTSRTKGYKKIATIAGTSYADKNIKSGTYYYKSRAYYYDTATGKKYYGPYSEPAGVKIIMGELYASAKQTGTTQATVSWEKVSGASKYEVYYRTNMSNDAYKLYKTVTGTNCKVSGLSKDTYYYFMVRAVKNSGATVYYQSSTATCKIGFKAPQNACVSKKSVTSNASGLTITSTIKWDKLYDTKKVRIEAYKSGYTDANGNWVDSKKVVLATLKGNATKYKFSNKITANDGGYSEIYVIAVNGKKEESVNVYDIGILPEPKGVTIKKKNASTSKISWKAVKGANKYRVVRVSPIGMESTIGETDKLTIDDTYMTPDVEYTYRVIAINDKFARYVSSDSYGTGSKTYTHKLSATKITSVKNTSSKKATITWNKVDYADSYVVYRSTSKNGKYKKVATVKDKTSYTDSKLTKKKTYYYKVMATGTNAAGFEVKSAQSAAVSIKITK